MKFLERLNLWNSDKQSYSKLFKFNPYFIAEIGVNHENSIDNAKLMIKQAASAGANAVKFQSYKADKLTAKESPSYWDTDKESTTSQYELFKKYDALETEDYFLLKDFSEELGIEFLTTPFDDVFVDELDNILDYYKVASADLTNYPLLRKIASKGKPLILSTGASTKVEIKESLDFLDDFDIDIILNQCILSYPTEIKNANLGMIADLINTFPKNIIGFSDHTPPTKDFNVQIFSILLGSTFIEKHFTLDKNLPGNDHYHSFDYEDLKNFRKKLANFEEIYGIEEKQVIDIEIPARQNARRSLYFKEDIDKDTVITNNHLISKRPGTGISPKHIDEIIGKTLNRSVLKDEKLELGMFD